MLNLLGTKQNMQTILVLAKLCAKDINIITIAELKHFYLCFLKEIQPDIPHVSTKNCMWVNSPDQTTKLIEVFNQDNALNDTEHSIIISNKATYQIVENVNVALQTFSKQDSTFYSFFHLVMNIIFTAPCKTAFGGTTSNAIGVLWIAPYLNWKVRDYIEFFVHELTHTLLFLDERRYIHYRNYLSITHPDTFALSSILGMLRPLDKVIHSIVVATEILLLRDKFTDHGHSASGLHPSTNLLVEQTYRSIHSVGAVPNINDLLAPRAFELLECCSMTLDRLEKEFEKSRFYRIPTAKI